MDIFLRVRMPQSGAESFDFVTKRSNSKNYNATKCGLVVTNVVEASFDVGELE